MVKVWQEVTLDLSQYEGQSVTIKFKFDTINGLYNKGEGLYIDNVIVYHGC
jgi:hypothetical protein